MVKCHLTIWGVLMFLVMNKEYNSNHKHQTTKNLYQNNIWQMTEVKE